MAVMASEPLTAAAVLHDALARLEGRDTLQERIRALEERLPR
jgi:hypothetical protein